MPNKKQLSEFIGITPGFLRSTNLANDWDKTDSSQGYIITPNVIQSLGRIFKGLTIQMGKKHFL